MSAVSQAVARACGTRRHHMASEEVPLTVQAVLDRTDTQLQMEVALINEGFTGDEARELAEELQEVVARGFVGYTVEQLQRGEHREGEEVRP